MLRSGAHDSRDRRPGFTLEWTRFGVASSLSRELDVGTLPCDPYTNGLRDSGDTADTRGRLINCVGPRRVIRCGGFSARTCWNAASNPSREVASLITLTPFPPVTVCAEQSSANV